MRAWRGLIAVVAAAAVVAGCQREHLVQPGAGPTAQAAPPLANEDISAIYAYSRARAEGEFSTMGGYGSTRWDLPAQLAL